MGRQKLLAEWQQQAVTDSSVWRVACDSAVGTERSWVSGLLGHQSIRDRPRAASVLGRSISYAVSLVHCYKRPRVNTVRRNTIACAKSLVT
jgi:hypothetical protein